MVPGSQLRAGLMESVKAGIIRDRALVRYMEEHAREVELQRVQEKLVRVLGLKL